ncbi:YrhK family protein [Thalassorhabdus alkalitolerans]|uniref:YrhK family protein n=1 Tax=Thalassorhabdus alkalitolerans TaxID=2282697 RepID=A0ABW0YQK3_9BACI
MPQIQEGKEYLDVKAGRFRLYFYRRYKVITVINDLLIGILFVTGSLLNFSSQTEIFGMVAYLLGSIFLFIRPLLRLIRNTSLRRDITDKDTYTTDG